MTSSIRNASSVSSTREALMDAAQGLIQQKGYSGFSYEDLSRLVGIRKPSIHHHFPKKELLGARVIERYTERFRAQLDDIDTTSTGVTTSLNMYIQLFTTTYGKTRKLCPCGILGAESAALPSIVCEAVRDFFLLNLTWLTDLLECGLKDRQFSFGASATSQALFVLSALEGAMVVGRGIDGDDTVSNVGEILIANLGVPGVIKL